MSFLQSLGETFGMRFGSADRMPALIRPTEYLKQLTQENNPANQDFRKFLEYSKRLLSSGRTTASELIKEAKDTEDMFKKAPEVWLNVVLAFKNNADIGNYRNLRYDVKEAYDALQISLKNMVGEQHRFAFSVAKDIENFLRELSHKEHQLPLADNDTHPSTEASAA